MKILSIAVPCYNSENYMRKCLDSLVIGGDEVEVIVVNDGSTDKTQEIGEEYVSRYPNIVRLVNKVNGGHGSAVNTGIREATGKYMKIVDSDDWVDKDAYMQILEKLREFCAADGSSETKPVDKPVVDMLVSNFVYEKVGEKHNKVMAFKRALPPDCYFTWDDVRSFNVGQYILMHSVIFRTELLRECKLELPEHTFYVDNLYVFQPLPWVKNMYYLNVDFYRYFIGRDDQSVNEAVMTKRIDQQIKVNKMMIDFFADINPKSLNKRLEAYMFNYLKIITSVSSILLIKANTKETLAKKRALWKYLKDKDLYIYKKVRRSKLGVSMNLPGAVGRKISVIGYKVCQKIFKFN